MAGGVRKVPEVHKESKERMGRKVQMAGRGPEVRWVLEESQVRMAGGGRWERKIPEERGEREEHRSAHPIGRR